MTEAKINRRDFLKVVGTAGASLVIGVYLNGCDTTDAPEATTQSEDSGETSTQNLPVGTFEPDIYIKIDSNSLLTVTAFRSEMGQGIRTAIAMMIADELDMPWENVIIEQADADPAYGDQVTGGSASIATSNLTVRLAGASARSMLIKAAAQYWDVDPDNCTTEAGFVLHPDGKQKYSYGELAWAASEQETPRFGEAKIKSADEFLLIGTGVSHWDAPEIVTGKAVYGFDLKIPDMLYAVLARCPVFGGRVASFDASKSEAIEGVQQVLEINGKVAVVAENTWAAIKGRDALEITWDEGDNADLNSVSIQEGLAKKAPQTGSADEGSIEAIYTMPFEAHMTMEPMNCVADVREDSCEIWAPTQNPQSVKRAVQSAVKMGGDSVTVHVPLMGGGFGRRLQTDYAVEAAKISQAVGVPVKVIWTRDDDVQHDFYHPASFHYLSADPANPKKRTMRSFESTQIPIGAWRSVGEFTTAYPRESFIDELAYATNIDPLEMRRILYSGRALAVIELAAEKADWGEPLPEGWGRGMGYHATFGVTHVAMVAEVEVTDGNVRVHRVVVAVDPGQVINPDNLAAQMEGGVVFGMTATLKAQITVQDGRVQQNNFHDCPVLTFDEMPTVEVFTIEGTTTANGIGEMGVPPIAPTVANAIFDAIGKRIRHIPILAEDLQT